MNHDIFHRPFEVPLTLEERPTPKDYLSRHPDMDRTMTMWRVQTEGYLDGTGQLVGIVSNPRGFLDSPDTEIISSGVNTKGPDSVAIGRHGNFLMWGFAASPTYMTEEAKRVFVNAIHYIARFDGQAPIARKVRGSLTRDSLREALESISEEGYARTVARYDELRRDEEKRRAGIQERIEAGEEVSPMDRMILDAPPIQTPGRLDRIRRFLSDEEWARLGEDPDAIARYLTTNMGYVHPVADYQLRVDQELREFGVANDDPELLPRLVRAWREGDRPELAKKLLQRYTAHAFDTVEEWSRWLDANRDHLFFTEAGGYRWLSDRKDDDLSPSPVALAPDRGDPVAAALTVEPLGEDRYAVQVHVSVLDGWHAYGAVPKGAPYVPLTASLELPDGARQVGDWRLPPGRPDRETPGLVQLHGSFQLRCEIAIDPGAPPSSIGCTLRYQVCDEAQCLPPAKKRLAARLGAGAPGDRND